MNSKLTSVAAMASPPTAVLAPPRGGRVPLAARGLLKLLAGLEHGYLTLVLPDGSTRRLGAGRSGELRAQIHLHDWRVAAAVLKSGDIGLAESWIDGRWSTPDLPGLLRLLLANRTVLEHAIYGGWWGGLWHRLRHALNRNTLAGSRRNIHAHYDLGNAFYSTWLDAGMNYSSALFEGDFSLSLAQAQRRKLDRALTAARVQAGDRLLEIGCGWGGLAELAQQRGAQVTGLTLSTEQLAWAQECLGRTVARATDATDATDTRATAPDCDLRLQDYRQVDDGPYDAIVSIEMFEAVGRAWWPTYFETLARCLRPGGRACVQTITIADALFERYARSSDFIQQYIFPGGMLPSPGQFCAAAERAGLVVEQAHTFGPDYAETLRRWRQAFHAKDTELRLLGFDPPFMRTWDFYLAYCEAAFDDGSTDVVQYTLLKP
ncbi:MAG: hypothetical protein RIQ60_1312 [Pseudomonadota bacterium]|jgi:cyclopropane-fatty-acyl-phospholipid synthase